MDFWSYEAIEAALGADLADAIPELLRLADLEVRIPRLEILALERRRSRRQVGRRRPRPRAAGRRLRPLGVPGHRDTGLHSSASVTAIRCVSRAKRGSGPSFLLRDPGVRCVKMMEKTQLDTTESSRPCPESLGEQVEERNRRERALCC